MAKTTNDTGESLCPCGSRAAFSECCAPLLNGSRAALTAEQLMRSRYSGFVTRNEHYLRETWHPSTRPSRVRLDEQQRWLGLKIRATDAGREYDDSGTVEFVARFKIEGKGHRLHEVSRFEKVDGRWYYLDGQHL
ncbi:MAG: YchJ family protein [Halioglobus sp.]